MHKPHDYPLRIRFWHFLRGLLFYNTVYWKRASDDLRPPRLSREERASLQPAPDPDIVRPRERPRANPVPAKASQPASSSPPPYAAYVSHAVAPSSGAPMGNKTPIAPSVEPHDRGATSSEPAEQEMVVKRRRYRRRRNKPRASRSAGLLAAEKPEGFFSRLFKRKKRS